MGSGFAGEFHLRSYSCLFVKFVFRMCRVWTSGQEGLIRFPGGSGCLTFSHCRCGRSRNSAVRGKGTRFAEFFGDMACVGGRNCRRHALDLRPTGIRCRLDGLERNLDFSVAPFQRRLGVRRFPQLRAKGVSDHRQRVATRPAERTCSHLLMNWPRANNGPWAPRGFSSFHNWRGGELSGWALFPDAAVLGPVLAKLPSRSPHPL